MQQGLPVIAKVNPGNDLIDIINNYGVGKITTASDVSTLSNLVIDLIKEKDKDSAGYKGRCQVLFTEMFTVDKAANQLLSHFE